MRLKNIKYIALSLFGAALLASCINKYEDEPLLDIPQVAFNESLFPSTMNMTTGETLKISPVIIGGSDLQFEWKLGETVIATTPELTYELTEPGELFFDFRVTNTFGESTKRFIVNVVESIIPGIVFNTTEQNFSKSIGENIRLTAKPVGSVSILAQKWEVNGQNASISGTLDYPLTQKGTYTVKYTVTTENGDEEATFNVTALASEHNDRWFVMKDGEEYVFALADSPNKVLAHYAGTNVFKVETYSGAQNQKYRKGAYFGYSDANVSLEYYNYYNMGTHCAPVHSGTMAEIAVEQDGSCPADGFVGWYFIVNEYGDVRMVSFLQTWDSDDAHNPAHNWPGAIIRLSEDKNTAEIFTYSRFKDGVYDTSEYDGFGDKYYDFKIVNVKDMAIQ